MFIDISEAASLGLSAVRPFLVKMSVNYELAKHPAYDNELLKQVAKSQEEIDNLNIKASKEILKVEDSYNKSRKSLYQKRNKLIKRVSNFWWASLKNHPKIYRLLRMEDECLRSFKNLEVKQYKKIKSGYRINFYFEENPYFENKVLTKDINLIKAISTSTPIKWKEGKDLPKQLLAKSNHQMQVLPSSFLDWFLDNTSPNSAYIADLIKDDLWENPLYYYTYNEQK